MVPENYGFEEKDLEMPSKTYRLDLENGRVLGYADEISAMQQAVYKILRSERFESAIYSWNYGSELKNLSGKSAGYVYSELETRIKEALLQDDRINEVCDFSFSKGKSFVSVLFTVKTVFGSFTEERTVNI